MRRDSRGSETDRTRGTAWYLAGMLVLLIGAGIWDSSGRGLYVQWCIGGISWLLLLTALWCGPREYRIPTLALVLVASGFECIGSLIWRAYEYRLHNLPAYVPPGHGLFYLAALRVSALPALRRHGDAIVAAVGGASGLWLIYALESGQRPDQLGVLCWLLLIAFLGLGRDPLLFAVTCVLTVALEFYGTAMGTWCWAQALPGTHLSAANPPAAIGGGYCVLDALAAYLAWYAKPLARWLGRACRLSPMPETHMEWRPGPDTAVSWQRTTTAVGWTRRVDVQELPGISPAGAASDRSRMAGTTPTAAGWGRAQIKQGCLTLH